jgi:serine/threonine-protein kinase HipA
MTSDRAYVWTWLPGNTAPVVVGRVTERAGRHYFQYGRSYLDRDDAIALGPELPLVRGVLPPREGLDLAGCLRDALPDSWGQRAIAARLAGRGADARDVPPITYMLESGTNRFGAIDFQASATAFEPRDEGGSLDELHTAAQTLMDGGLLPPTLAEAFAHGTSIGGARPKVLFADGDRQFIAKLSSTSDRHHEMRAEAACLYLARAAGIRVPEFELTTSLGRDVLLVRRFDRLSGGGRRHALSALTLVGLHEDVGRYAAYPDFLDRLRDHPGRGAVDPGWELFRRIAFNIVVGNGDDHARNHAAFWDGTSLELTPAFDLAPQRPSGWGHNQAMAYGRGGERRADLRMLVGVSQVYGLPASEAVEVVDAVVTAVEEGWEEAADAARLTEADRAALWHAMILNPGIGGRRGVRVERTSSKEAP